MSSRVLGSCSARQGEANWPHEALAVDPREIQLTVRRYEGRAPVATATPTRPHAGAKQVEFLSSSWLRTIYRYAKTSGSGEQRLPSHLLPSLHRLQRQLAAAMITNASAAAESCDNMWTLPAVRRTRWRICASCRSLLSLQVEFIRLLLSRCGIGCCRPPYFTRVQPGDQPAREGLLSRRARYQSG